MTSDGSRRYADALSPIWHNSGGVNARTGQYMAYFNPFGPAASKLYQTILIPAGNTATLSFWLKIGVTSSSSSSDNLFVCFEDYSTKVDLGCPGVYSPADASGYSWVYHSYDVSRFAGKSVTLFFQSQVVASTVFQTDDVSVTTGSTTPPSSAACTETTSTMCLVGGRYRVTSYWKNQYAGGALSNLSKTTLTDATGAFWNANANAYEYFIRINTATDNGHAWIAISTLTDVEFFVVVYDTKTAQSFQYHSPAGNRTLIYDPSTFVYP